VVDGFDEEKRPKWQERDLRRFGCSFKEVWVCFGLSCTILTISSYTAGIPPDLAPSLVPQIKTYLSTSDISLLSHAFTILALLLDLSPSTTFPEVERDILKDIYTIAHSPLVSGVALDSALGFFSALVQADRQIATHVVPCLVSSIEKEQMAPVNPANVAKCVAQVVRSQQDVAAGTIAEFSKHLKVCLHGFQPNGY
jgi:cullin-associated NEDD8-dissociated protein 1